MKPTPVLTMTDYTILRKLVKNAKDATNIREIALLTQELQRTPTLQALKNSSRKMKSRQ